MRPIHSAGSLRASVRERLEARRSIDDSIDAGIMRNITRYWSRERSSTGMWYRATFGLPVAEASELLQTKYVRHCTCNRHSCLDCLREENAELRRQRDRYQADLAIADEKISSLEDELIEKQIYCEELQELNA